MTRQLWGKPLFKAWIVAWNGPGTEPSRSKHAERKWNVAHVYPHDDLMKDLTVLVYCHCHCVLSLGRSTHRRARYPPGHIKRSICCLSQSDNWSSSLTLSTWAAQRCVLLAVSEKQVGCGHYKINICMKLWLRIRFNLWHECKHLNSWEGPPLCFWWGWYKMLEHTSHHGLGPLCRKRALLLEFKGECEIHREPEGRLLLWGVRFVLNCESNRCRGSLFEM